MTVAVAVFIGFIADCIFGDPVYRFHPVRIMGKFISVWEKVFKNNKQNKILSFISGTILSLLLIGFSFALPFLFLISIRFTYLFSKIYNLL